MKGREVEEKENTISVMTIELPRPVLSTQNKLSSDE